MLVNNCDLSLGEVVSSIHSNPSPEFLNSLPFIKKFYPLPAGAREKFIKVSHDNSCNSRHSEAHSPSAKKLQKTRRSARLFCNFENTFNTNENSSSRKNSAYLLYKEQFPDIVGAPCTKNSKQLLNGIGCSWYALNNINPDDESKKYWDSLPW